MANVEVWGWDDTNKAWVKILVNAEGKLIIDPTEIFENIPTDDEHGKAPDSDWAHDHAVNPDIHHPAPVDDSVNKEVVIPFDGGGGGGSGFPSSPPEGGIQIDNIYYDPVNEEQILET